MEYANEKNAFLDVNRKSSYRKYPLLASI